MGIFHRPPKRDQGSARRDAEYTFFSADEGAYFRALVREAFAERGLEVTVHAKAAGDNTRRQFDLHDLAVFCHQEPRGRKRWPRLIHGYVGRMVRVIDGPLPLDHLPPDQLLDRLRPWVVERDFLGPHSDRYIHARVVAPGLCEVLALDLDESVMILPDTVLTPLGDIVDLRARALTNLRALPIESHTVLQGAKEMHFDVVTGDSFFTASRVSETDELARQLTGRRLGPDGALVAMPNRHHLAFRRLDTVRETALVPTLHAMTAFAAVNFEGAVGPVSPDVYWWREGELTRLVRQDVGGRPFMDNLEFDMLQTQITEQ